MQSGGSDPELAALEKCHLITNGCAIPAKRRGKVLNLVDKMQMAIASRPPGQTFRFQLKDFDFGGKLGSGRFGTVFLVKEKKTEFLLALKSVDKELIKAAGMDTILKREITIHSKLSHDNIVKFFTLFDDPVNWYMLMEYIPGGTLCQFRYLQKENRVKPSLVIKYTRQLGGAIGYLHSLKVVHRDVKPDNVLLDIFGNVKLADFGWAACCSCVLRQYCGTSYYIAPEIIEQKGYNHKVDIWSLGVVLFELLCGETPFVAKDARFVLKKIRTGNLSFAVDVDPSAVDLITSLLKYNPDERPQSSEILIHPWINT